MTQTSGQWHFFWMGSVLQFHYSDGADLGSKAWSVHLLHLLGTDNHGNKITINCSHNRFRLASIEPGLWQKFPFCTKWAMTNFKQGVLV